MNKWLRHSVFISGIMKTLRKTNVLAMAVSLAVLAGCTSQTDNEARTGSEPSSVPETAADLQEKTLHMEEQQENLILNYDISDPAYMERFEGLLEELTAGAAEGEIQMADGYDNIMDFHITSDTGFIGFQKGNFPYGSVMYENMLYTEAAVLKDGRRTSEEFLLIPADSQRGMQLCQLVSDIQANAQKEEYSVQRDPVWVESFLNSIGDPRDYIYPYVPHFKMENAEQWDGFVQKVNSGQRAWTVIGVFTIEGDVIYNYVEYNGSDFFWAMDMSRDRYIDPENTFLSGQKKYFSSASTAAEDGGTYEKAIAVLGDEKYSSYEEIEQALQEGNDLIVLWSYTHNTAEQ